MNQEKKENKDQREPEYKGIQLYGSKVLNDRPVIPLTSTGEGKMSGGDFPIFWPIVIIT